LTLFELIKITLDELYAQGLAEHGDMLDTQVTSKMKYLTDSYRKLTSADRVALSYQDPATRIAYVHSYVATHADYLVQIFEKFNKKYPDIIFNKESIRLSCVGGGPGSDILAVLKFLSENDTTVEKIICYLLDGEQAWADTWTELDDSISGKVNLKTNFQALDVTAPDSWKFQKNFKNADLFTFSYFVSEVFNLGEDGVVDDFFSGLMADAKPGAVFVYVDNAHSDFYSYFDGLWKAVGLECLMAESDIKWTPRYSEQASSISEYIDRFGRSPKLKGNITYRVLRKPEDDESL
jgi:hypothetical protein